MTKKQIAHQAVELLEKEYPDASCSLNASNALELLIATRLSAQCTDARVNIVTPKLFEKYKTLDDYCNAQLEDVEGIIHSCGFYHDKAKSIIEMSKMIKGNFDSKVPDTIENLIKLPGVGRKTANLIVGDIYGKTSVVVDTHCIRITNRLGLVSGKNPLTIEMELRKLLPLDKSGDFCHRLVLHGRAVCSARKADCNACVLHDICRKVGVKK